MKANAPKRKVFQDAVDLLGMPEEMAVPESNGQTMIPVEKIVPFHNHPFRLYEGERLDDMVESIKEHGVLNPVIVHKVADGYEMLAGHNRWNAAKIAGIREIPAIVKEDLSKEEAYVYVIETNLMQRSFTDLLPSEKAAVLAERYEIVMCQGKSNDILEEIARLNGTDTSDSCGHDVHKLKNRDGLGEEYGLSGRSVARLLRVNELVPELKEMLDTGKLNLVVAVQLSYAPEDVQKTVSELGKPIGKDIAVKLREDGIKASDVAKIVCGVEKKLKSSSKTVKISLEAYEKYFNGIKPEAITTIVEKALAAWFDGKESESV